MTEALAAWTWEEARMWAPATVALLPVGAIEAHGPHLPLGTDIAIAEAMAEAAAERLVAAGHPAAVLPPLVYTPATFAAGFPGTVSIDPDALTATVSGLAASLARHRFRALAIANAHFDPQHLAALRSAAGAPAGLPVIFPDVTRRPWVARLTDEFRSGACHAGRYETSILLAARPELVREAERAALEPVDVSLTDAIQGGRRSFEEAGGPRAYFGDPAAASRAEGEATIQTLGAILAEAVLAALEGGDAA